MNRFESILNSLANQVFGLGRRKYKPSKQFKGIVAHRGVHENDIAMENTMAAFDLAYENQIWGVECDVRFTKDDIPVIHHDADLGRLFNKAEVKISNVTFLELHRLAPDIPSLEQLVQKHGGKIHFMIEMKEPIHNDTQREVLRKTLATLKFKSDYHFMALDPEILESLQWTSKEAYICISPLLTGPVINEVIKSEYGGFAGHFVLLTDSQRKRLKKHQIEFGTGYIETQGCLYRELSRECTWIFTNQPLRLKGFLN